jgi:tetratricopeptide (TPR) repeat protein
MPDEHPAPPLPATPAPAPADVASNEELFLHGLHLEQYRHATFNPEPYYQEALRRDPEDSRCNNALGLRRLRQGQFAEAEGYLRRAVARLTRRNPNPYDGESYYNLGLALRWQGRFEEACNAFYKATWNAAWQDAAFFELARLAARRGDDADALDLLTRCLDRNRRHYGAQMLEAALLRRSGRTTEASAAIADGLARAPLHYGLHFEQFLLTGDRAFHELVQDDPYTPVELALAYAHAGLFDAADRLLADAAPGYPLVHYYHGWIKLQAGDEAGADACFAQGAAASPDGCFPNEIECAPALCAAMARRPGDARAPYYLGNFLYAHRVYDQAIAHWEQAAALDPTLPTAHRNLGLAYMDKRGDGARAQACYARAFALEPADSRVLFELDQLHKKLGETPAVRLARLVKHRRLVEDRDDLTVEYVTLLNLTGRHADALEVLLARTFHPWEGGEGKVSGQYVVALVELAKTALARGDAATAIDYLERARTCPDNLAEGKLAGAPENQIDYWLGEAYAQRGDQARAAASYRRAAQGELEFSAAMYYNDRPPEMVYYQALAYAALGDAAQSAAICQALVNYGEMHRDDEVQMDYFAVSLPDFLVFEDDLSRRNHIHCAFMAGLGRLGLGEAPAAATAFTAVLAMEPAHLGATLALHACQEQIVP